MTDYETFQARWAAQHARQQQANTGNTKAILDALAALAIERVEVEFDGYGDSGQIGYVTVTGATDTLSGEVTVETVCFDASPHSASKTLAEAVEDLCYNLLAIEHCGWQDNDGAFGSFTFDVAKREISLECNTRFSAYDTAFHTFSEAA